MTRRLFWKIFISFWLAQMAFIAYMGIRANQLFSTQGPLWQLSAQKTMPLIGQAALQQFQSGGQPALKAELAKHSDPERIHYWLLDPKGDDLTGVPYPQPVMEALTAHRAGRSAGDQGNHAVLFANIKDAGGKPYTLVGHYLLNRSSSLFRGEGLVRAIFISSLLSGLTCLLLAHYLTRPIRVLRGATQQLASGDLDARAGKDLGNRSDEIADLVRDFDRMADRIGDLLQSQRRLLSDVSHELRSPLARLRVALALSRRTEDAAQNTSHDRIEREVERLDELIGRILTLSRLESGQVNPPMEQLDLNQIAEEVVEDAKYEADRTGHSVKLESAGQMRVNGNEDLLRSAIENVVRNAIYYTTGAEPVTVRLSTQNGSAVITVRDHGAGVPDAILPDLFRPFYRADDSRMTGTGGTGLGLAIAEKAVKLHGGSISARNASPNGLIVEMIVPCIASVRPAAQDRDVVPQNV
jgi:signal transduction histidine kinase